MHAAANTAPKAGGRVVRWNKGKRVGQKRPFRLKGICAIRIRLQLNHQAQELALFNLAVDSKLRGCDLVGLHVRDVFQGSHVAPRAIVMHKKTQRRTRPTLIYRRTRNLRAVPLLLGHSKLESTVRYLGIEVDDSAKRTELDKRRRKPQHPRVAVD